MQDDPGDAFNNGALLYIGIGQVAVGVVFVAVLLMIWAVFFRRLGPARGFAFGLPCAVIAAAPIALLAGLIWPVSILGVAAWAIARLQARPQGHVPPEFQP